MNNNEKTAPEKIVVEAVSWTRDNGETGVTVPQIVLENTTLAGRELVIKHVDKLAFQYDDEIFQRICLKESLTRDEVITLKQLIFLNSGYISPPLMQAHLKKGYGLCARLRDELVDANQAADPQGQRKLYSPPTNSPTRKRFTVNKSDFKDILNMLFLSLVIIATIFACYYLFFNDKKNTDIYVRDQKGNYVLDAQGRAVTKQEQCRKDHELSSSLGYEQKVGYCDISGKWVQTN